MLLLVYIEPLTMMRKTLSSAMPVGSVNMPSLTSL